MIVRLTIVSALEVLALVATLIYFLYRTVRALDKIGGASDDSIAIPSLLGRANWGVRAIEQETGHLKPQINQLNQALGKLAEQLAIVDDQLKDLADKLPEAGEVGG